MQSTAEGIVRSEVFAQVRNVAFATDDADFNAAITVTRHQAPEPVDNELRHSLLQQR